MALITSFGNLTVANLTTTGPNNDLGNVGDLHISGGTNGQVLTTDGNANLSWTTVSGSSYGNSNVAAYLPTNDSNVSGNNFTVSGNITAGSYGLPQQLLFYSTTPTTVTFDLMGSFPPPFSAGQTMQISGIEAGGPTELNGLWTVVSCDGVTVVISCNLQPTLPFTTLVYGRVADITNISTTGNVTGAYFIGDGSQLTNLPSGYGNAEVSAYLASGTDTAGYTTSGLITTGVIEFGTIKGSPTIATTDGSGLILDQDVTIGGNVNTTLNISASTVAASYFIGDGSNLANVAGTNVVGEVANAAYATAAGSVFGINVVGEVANAAYATNAGSAIEAATAASANAVALANVSGAGNIAAVNLDGNVANVLAGDGTWVAAGGGSSYGDSNVTSLLASGTVSSNITTTANVSGGYLLGNVSQATGLGNIVSTNLNGDVTTTLAGDGTWATAKSNSVIAGSNTIVSLNNITALVGGTPTRLFIGTVSGNMTVAGQSQTLLSGSQAVSSWINVPITEGVGNGFAMSGAIANNGEMAILTITDQDAGTGTWRVTGVIANTAANLYSVSIEKIA